MAPSSEPQPRPLPPQRRTRLTAVEIVAAVLSAAWLAGAAVYVLWLAPGEAVTGQALQFVTVLIAVFMPVAMLWVGATAARASRTMREESARLRAAIDAIREAYLAQNHALGATVDKTVAQKLDEIVAAQRKTESALATFSSVRAPEPPRPVQAPPPPPDTASGQVVLPLGTPAEDMAPPLERADFIRALNFPESPEDKAGFTALRRALKDRPTAQLVRAAQDVLTLLAQDGIYMDDLRPDRARPEIWRRFAHGQRHDVVAHIGRPAGDARRQAVHVPREQAARGFLEAGPVAGHGGHEAIGRLAPPPRGVFAPPRLARLLHQPAQGGRRAARLLGQPVPVTGQQGHFPSDHAQLRPSARAWGRGAGLARQVQVRLPPALVAEHQQRRARPVAPRHQLLGQRRPRAARHPPRALEYRECLFHADLFTPG